MAKPVLTLCALFEALIGVVLVISPGSAGTALFGTEFAGSAIPIARIAGLALIGLAIACRPGPPYLGMLVYGVTVMLYLAFLGVTGGAAGWLLWPAVGLHLALVVLLLLEARRDVSRP